MAKGEGTAIGNRYGESAENFQKVLGQSADKIMLEWANESIAIMRKIITRKARTKQASTLAADLVPKPFPIDANGNLRIEIVTMQDYWQFVDEGVKGVYNKSKAPKSPFSFRNLGVSPDMLSSFKQYIARTGSKGLRKQTLIRKNKKKQADLITKEAMAMAVATKIGGIRPMNFVEPAVGAKRLKKLSEAMSKEIGKRVSASIVSEF
jgi:hypothetical protein